jgi:hypothetical protein
MRVHTLRVVQKCQSGDKYVLFHKHLRTHVTGEAQPKLLVRQESDEYTNSKFLGFNR